jgi:hypothetical protein
MYGRTLITRTLLTCLLLGVTFKTTQAQGSAGAKGFFLGAGLNGSLLNLDEALDDEDDESENGGGLMLQLGFGFNPKLALFLEGSAAAMDTEGESWALVHGDLGLRYHFAAPGRKLVPFLDGAFTVWSVVQDDAELGNQTGELEISGGGLTLGGGFLYFFSSRMALNAQLKFTRGEFNEVRFENVSIEGLDIDASSARLNFGLTWFLGGGR